MSSTAVAIISSSPPRAFARSPTPAELSSPLHSPGTPLRDGAKRFKTSTQPRDRGLGGFSSTRALLTVSGVENIPLRSPNTAKFKSKSSQTARDESRSPIPAAKFIKKKSIPQTEQISGHFKPTKPPALVAASILKIPCESELREFDDEIEELPFLESRGNSLHGTHSSPHPMEKAVPRRLDWTPVKQNEYALETPESEKQDIGFQNNLLRSYAFATSAAKVTERATTKLNGNAEHLKRTRIDLVMATETKPLSSTSKSNIAKETKSNNKGKAKAPAKKALTITGLATSAYGDEQQKESKLPPMLEYLTATQAATGSDKETGIDVSLKKSKAPNKKVRTTTKASTKSRLVSPTSAMKATFEQQFLFGPASQLARDESSALAHDTLEALKQSECYSSEPISPHQTQPVSTYSTSPRVPRGTNRLVKSRNLWGAAGRDEDNALLHVDTVDLTDSPAVRQALAGKDVLLQPNSFNRQGMVSVDYGSTSLALAQTPHIKHVGPLIDIDDIVTPGLPKPRRSLPYPQARAMHTSRMLEEPQKQTDIEHQHGGGPLEARDPPSKPKPVMPSYTGWSDHELKKQISAFGFKAIKKREKMIALLEQCWESKHGIEHDSDLQDIPANALTHGDFLSKVHDVSARPTPKVKKPRAKRKSETGDTPTVKEPKKRKKAATKVDDVLKKERKAPLKEAPKKALSDDKVIDVDDIDDASVEQPTGGRTGLAGSSKQSKEKRPATPPPTIPQLDFSSSPALEELQPLDAIPEVADPVLTPEQTPSADIMTQIHAAIHYCSKTPSRNPDSRNHQVSPTWREKILMYDPIVLEELTLWLNTEGFKAISEDREVSPLEVRSWCEQNGVCCYGVGGGWRGRGRRVEAE